MHATTSCQSHIITLTITSCTCTTAVMQVLHSTPQIQIRYTSKRTPNKKPLHANKEMHINTSYMNIRICVHFCSCSNVSYYSHHTGCVYVTPHRMCACHTTQDVCMSHHTCVPCHSLKHDAHRIISSRLHAKAHCHTVLHDAHAPVRAHAGNTLW